MNTSKLDDFYAARWQEREITDISVSRKRRLILVDRFLKRCLGRGLPELNILDYGCGSGWLIAHLEDLGFQKIHAYDVTPSVLETLRLERPNVKIWKGDGTLPSLLPPSSFDVVLSIEVLEHLSYEVQKAYFDDLRRVCRSNALVLLTTPNGLLKHDALPKDKEQPIEDWVTKKRLRNLALSSGFTVIEMGTKGIFRYGERDRILLSYRLRKFLTRVRLWGSYCRLLEALGRGITIFAVLKAMPASKSEALHAVSPSEDMEL